MPLLLFQSNQAQTPVRPHTGHMIASLHRFPAAFHPGFSTASILALALVPLFVLAPLALSQAVESAKSEVVALPAFTVSTVNDNGYRAGGSVSATRFDTPFKDRPHTVSAFAATSEYVRTADGKPEGLKLPRQEIDKFGAEGVVGVPSQFSARDYLFALTSPPKTLSISYRFRTPFRFAAIKP